MARTESQSMSRSQFLTVSGNLLHKAFVESQRTQSKNLYRALEAGKRVALTTLRMEDNSSVRIDLKLDCSEYEGRLNYSAFRASLMALLGNLAAALREEREISTFGPQGNPNMMIFGVAGVTVEDGQPAVMVLAADTAGRDASVLLQLMYLDYEQFQNSQQTDRAAPA